MKYSDKFQIVNNPGEPDQPQPRPVWLDKDKSGRRIRLFTKLDDGTPIAILEISSNGLHRFMGTQNCGFPTDDRDGRIVDVTRK